MVETWLLERLPANLNSKAGHLPQSAIADFGYQGDIIRDMRKRNIFFVQKTAVHRSWRRGFTHWKITSDQVFHMLIGVGNLDPSHCVMLALFLGVLPHTSPFENMGMMQRALVQTPTEQQSGDADIRPWNDFLEALRVAGGLQIELLIAT